MQHFLGQSAQLNAKLVYTPVGAVPRERALIIIAAAAADHTSFGTANVSVKKLRQVTQPASNEATRAELWRG